MRVEKWGDRLAVRLPTALVDALNLREGDEISGDEVLPGFRCPIAKFFPPRKTSAKPKRKPRNGKS